MKYLLLGTHIGFGELAGFIFLAIGIALYSKGQKYSLYTKAANVGIICLFLSFITGGYYYLTDYGSIVKPVIKNGPIAWAHLISMEAKEHIFLFLPFAAFFVARGLSLLRENEKSERFIKLLANASLLVFVISMGMAVLGFAISIGYRYSLEIGG